MDTNARDGAQDAPAPNGSASGQKPYGTLQPHACYDSQKLRVMEPVVANERAQYPCYLATNIPPGPASEWEALDKTDRNKVIFQSAPDPRSPLYQLHGLAFTAEPARGAVRGPTLPPISPEAQRNGSSGAGIRLPSIRQIINDPSHHHVAQHERELAAANNKAERSAPTNSHPSPPGPQFMSDLAGGESDDCSMDVENGSYDSSVADDRGELPMATSDNNYNESWMTVQDHNNVAQSRSKKEQTADQGFF